MMGNVKSRPHLVIIGWFVWAFICLIIMASGVAWLAGWIRVNVSLPLRYACGLLQIILGVLAAYYGALKFFWYVVKWLSRGKTKNGNSTGRGPKIVVIGGGTGLGTILRGLKEVSSNITAIVTVADDGGSSGRLRREFGILPPGDIRNCLVAMADLEPLMEKLMQYRFDGDSVFAGHNFGNLFLTALINVTGDFEKAIKESSKVLAVRGRVLPATLEHVTLNAEFADGTVIRGESAIPLAGRPITRVFLEPKNIKPVAESIIAIKEADVILLGPGSLYTSVIPNLLVADIADAIRSSNAAKVYVCNAMTQPGETEGYSASQHIQAIINHAGTGLIDYAVVNTGDIPARILGRYAEEGSQPVEADLERIKALGINPIAMDIIKKTSVIRHDALKLAELILELARRRKIENVFGKGIMGQLYRLFKGF
mgnify:CR=1 FL=1